LGKKKEKKKKTEKSKKWGWNACGIRAGNRHGSEREVASGKKEIGEERGKRGTEETNRKRYSFEKESVRRRTKRLTL